MVSLICGIQKSTFIEKESRFLVARGGGWEVVEELGERSEKVQNSRYKINKY